MLTSSHARPPPPTAGAGPPVRVTVKIMNKPVLGRTRPRRCGLRLSPGAAVVCHARAPRPIGL